MGVELSPAIVLVSACKDIVDEYTERHPERAEQTDKELKEKETDNDVRAYLAARGKHIWEDFLARKGLQTTVRDYSPLTSEGIKSIDRGMKNALTELDSFKDFKPTSALSTFYKAQSRSRFWTGVAFVAIGFAVFFTTYFGLPWIAGQLLEAQLKATTGTVVKELEGHTDDLKNLPLKLEQLTIALSRRREVV